MGLEAPNFIADLNPSWPTGNLDTKGEGDNHLRAIKLAIKASLPGFTGRIWRRRNVSASGPVTLNDNTSLVRCSQTLTITPDAASVLGEWMAIIRADGGDVTIDPGQPINGAASMVVPNGYSGFLFCDGSEFFLTLMYSQLPATVKAFPTGTNMVFQQTSAPIGWTKLTSAAYNDAAIRLTTGTVGSGGADVFTSVFSGAKNSSGFTLGVTHIPAHSHTYDVVNGVQQANASTNTDTARSGAGNTGNTGGGASHAHAVPTMNIKYIDFIVASIN